VLDAELNHLPHHYRAPLLLCDLEGKTQKQAAHELGCPAGTLAVRLMRARSLLAKRLARRGVVLSTGSLAILLPNYSPAAISAALFASTVKTGIAIAAGHGAAAGTISTNASHLTKMVLNAMVWTKVSVVSSVLVAGLIALGAAITAYDAANRTSQNRRVNVPPTEILKAADVLHHPKESHADKVKLMHGAGGNQVPASSSPHAKHK
jgi:hypothetical protein